MNEMDDATPGWRPAARRLTAGSVQNVTDLVKISLNIVVNPVGYVPC